MRLDALKPTPPGGAGVLWDQVLANMFGVQDRQARWGRMLVENDLEIRMREQRAERDEYERSHPDDVEELRALVAAAAARS